MGVWEMRQFNLTLGPYTLPRLLSPKPPFHLVTELKDQSQLLVTMQDIMKPRRREKGGLRQADPQVCA